MHEEIKAFQEYLKKGNLKLTNQRLAVVRAAFSTHRHFTAEEMLALAKKADPTISRATVYRTLFLLAKAKLLDKQDFERGKVYYEHLIGHHHHDHLVCLKCGRIYEFENTKIEQMQRRVVTREKFIPLAHSLKIFGICRQCRREVERTG